MRMIGTENAAALPLGPEFGAVCPFEVFILGLLSTDHRRNDVA